MSGNVFVDTNVFVYLFDADDPTRQDIARSLIDRLAKEATIVVSTQVLQEFYVSVTRKLAEPLPPQQAMEATRGLSTYRVVQLDPSMIFAAIALHEKEVARERKDFFLGRVDRSGSVGIVLRASNERGHATRKAVRGSESRQSFHTKPVVGTDVETRVTPAVPTSRRFSERSISRARCSRFQPLRSTLPQPARQ